MSKPKILVFAGSTRQQSFNKKLIRIAVGGAEAAGGDLTLIDLRDYPMPLYDGDLEANSGIPDNGMKLKKLFLEHRGLLLSCPEYNSSISGVLKNTLDWVSRTAPGEKPLECFKGKAVTLMSASPGNLGGLRGLVHVRAILGNIGCIVLPDQIAVNKAGEAFDEDGQLRDANQQKAIQSLGAGLVDFLRRLQ
ncbi:MAG: NAD(P)H-dependent oxidoreductase [Gammaproteobacteria bacterium]